jgi:hypothetical protein
MSDTFRLQGLDPSTELGKYFDDSKWWWHGLWDYIYSLCSDFLTPDDYINGHRIEDGYIIENETALQIAEKLLKAIESGHCRDFEKKTTSALENLPEKIDGNTGKMAKPEELMYPFTVENAKAFANFCLTCGGFIFLKREN